MLRTPPQAGERGKNPTNANVRIGRTREATGIRTDAASRVVHMPELPAAAVPADNPSPNFDFADVIAKLTHSVPLDIAGQILHRGRTWLYGALGSGLLDGVKNGPNTEITIESIKRYQANMQRKTFAPPPPPRMEALDKLHEKQRQRAEQRRAKRAQLRRSKARGG